MAKGLVKGNLRQYKQKYETFYIHPIYSNLERLPDKIGISLSFQDHEGNLGKEFMTLRFVSIKKAKKFLCDFAHILGFLVARRGYPDLPPELLAYQVQEKYKKGLKDGGNVKSK